MTLTLYVNHSENNAINKAIEYVGDLTGDLKQATSILNPSILIEMDNGVIDYNIDLQAENDDIAYTDDSTEYDLSININYNIFDCNYCYIKEFERYYYIDNIIIQNNKLFMLVLSVDVLESYKNQFLPLDAFVSRNEFDYNVYLNDSFVNYYQDKDVNEFVADKGDMVNMTFKSSSGEHNAIINCSNLDIRNHSATTGVSNSDLPVVATDSSGMDFTSNTYAFNQKEIVSLSIWYLFTDLISGYVNSVMVYPFDIPNIYEDEWHLLQIGSTTLRKQIIGTNNLDVRDVYCYDIQPISPYMIIADFTIQGNSFMDYEPYSQYEIFLPYLTWIQVSANDILNNRIIVYYVVDYTSGTAQATIYDLTNKKLIYTSNTQLGVKIGFTTTNNQEIQAQRTNNNTALAISLISGFTSFVTSAMTNNVGGAVKSGVGMMTSALQYDISNNGLFTRASGQVSSGQNGLYLPQDVKIRITRMKPRNYNEDFAKYFGKPLQEYRTLENLKGFTQISDIHLENIKATKSEIELIASSLKNGVIIK